ncbi:MAG: hypothetical protein MZV63_27135 [Marinilabiliales bacterium]|nr:hypothetical protein [Marinilabiliales bacterium]
MAATCGANASGGIHLRKPRPGGCRSDVIPAGQATAASEEPSTIPPATPPCPKSCKAVGLPDRRRLRKWIE